MKTYQGINVKIMNVLRKAMIGVRAEEPNNANPPVTQPTINYEDLIAKARKEEKDKLYPQIENYKTQITDLTKRVNELLLSEAQAVKEKDVAEAKLKSVEENVGKTDNEVITKLQGEVATLQKQLKDSQKNIVPEDKLRAEIEAELKTKYEVEMYKTQLLNSDDYRGKIIPELVTGYTKEEIENSIKHSKERYLEIVGKVEEPPTQTQPQGVQPSFPQIPSANPQTNSFAQGMLSDVDIQSMTPQQWAEYRKKLGLK